MNIRRRIEKAEKRLSMDRDDEHIRLDFGDGQVWEGTYRKLSEIFRKIRENRHFPRDVVHAQPCQTP